MRLNAIHWDSDTALISKNKKEALRFDLRLGNTYTSITVSGEHRSVLEEALTAPEGDMVFFEDMWERKNPDDRLKVESRGDSVDISIVREAFTFTIHFTPEETADLLAFFQEELPERFRD